MTAPLRAEFGVDCSAEHAFTVWTSGIGAWRPAGHTVTGRADLDIVLQRGAGGRIYERTPGGTEHDWGKVTVWSPPARLACLWHLRRDRSDATPRSRSGSRPGTRDGPGSESGIAAGNGWAARRSGGATRTRPAGRPSSRTSRQRLPPP
ncbi:MAG: hypothetical protein ABSA02_24395 [Trebonia sp.]|jgi:hypothetical protein